LSLDELQEIADQIATNKTEEKMAELIFNGEVVTPEAKAQALQMYKEQFMKSGNGRGFFEVIKDELKEIPTCVYVNIKGKQKYMAQNADKLTNVIREVIANAAAFQQNPGLAKPLNQLLEDSGLSPIDFTKMITAPPIQQPINTQAQPVQAPQGQ
jgi:hypothetical protein